ncbi:MAG: hypothetical protein JWN30_2746, partial [Bacilli bacterium]|nr:hypothetical protein [Bacilli bacterium]
MKELIAAQMKLVPDLVATMSRRYKILQQILLNQPIGRRSLAQQLHATERVLRGEVEFLRAQDLLAIEALGMRLTPAGARLVNDLDPVMTALNGMSELEDLLKERLGIPSVIVVPGDQDSDPLVKRELGYVSAKFIQNHLKDGDILAVTGGTTMAAVADMMPQIRLPNLVVIPARGGLGEQVETLANTIASTMAARLGGSHKLFHVPDYLLEEASQSLARDPIVAETLNKLRTAHMVVHGIGQAMT